ncbi:mini-chromosome maintenance complex-binding protein [Melanaphis sacchari]|uniref:mini-chromosome maintenance complex-binding protein n=1 Tax=Melanaphis sacchari TaxID=742174 RepID=UPI000DC13448|nr:mini-chromosome maintenance complex-binding protein [Melanaphis sacchari]
MDTWTADIWNDNEDECKKTLNGPGNWEKVPLFDNKIALGSFVRFKGMIQDMLNPEYYSSSFKIINSENEELISRKAKYHGSTKNIQPGEEVIFGDTLMERQIIACIPIPGLNEWAKDISNTDQNVEAQLEDNMNKRIRLDPACQNYSKEIFIFVYPEDIDTNELKVNQIVEVVGFLDRRTVQEDDGNLQEQSSIVKETYCIHAVQLKLLKSIISDNEEMNNSIWNEASNIHAELKLVLTQALLGDSLVADYLLFYLISTSYNRQHNLVPGKFSLNIRGIPENIGKNYTKHLYSLISYLVVKSEYLPIQIHTLNNMDMIPRKCYTSNRLLNGFLQLSDRTHLVLDETDLQPGNLDQKGMLNFEALKNIISNQQMKYDFTYYGMDYETQIPVLTLSIGKSILPFDVDIVLKPDPSCSNIEETMNSVHDYLKSQLHLLDKLRKYIAIISTFPFTYDESILKVIENDYVEMRKSDPKNVSGDDLHRFMMISRLIALSSGKNEFNIEIWESGKSLEKQRNLRNK